MLRGESTSYNSFEIGKLIDNKKVLHEAKLFYLSMVEIEALIRSLDI